MKFRIRRIINIFSSIENFKAGKLSFSRRIIDFINNEFMIWRLTKSCSINGKIKQNNKFKSRIVEIGIVIKFAKKYKIGAFEKWYNKIGIVKIWAEIDDFNIFRKKFFE
jgi:hypothetical protein